MLELFKSLTIAQYEATFCTLHDCVVKCPDQAWHGLVANHTFCQSAFHAVFYADMYLGSDVESFKAQPFHRDHPEIFRTYEEMEDKKPELHYEKPMVLLYIEHCRAKARSVIGAATEASLAARTGFTWHTISRAEMHLYNIRHIQHHAAQLTLRLRLDFGLDVPWVKTGWVKR